MRITVDEAALTFERAYPGTADQPGRIRADLTDIAGECPVRDELVLLASELAANAILHSKSGRPGRTFTVRAVLYPGNYAWVEVIDQGGAWTAGRPGNEHGRGLAIVATIAGDGNWGFAGDSSSRIAWFRLDWPRLGTSGKEEAAGTVHQDRLAALLGRGPVGQQVQDLSGVALAVGKVGPVRAPEETIRAGGD